MVEANTSSAKDKILDIAAALFRQQGYATISMRDIARKVGIKQASLYYHFPQGKEQLYVEVAEREFERHQAGLRQVMAQANPVLEAQLQAASGWFASQPPLSMLSMLHTDMPVLSEAHQQRLMTAANQAVFQPVRQIFAGAQQRGESRPINPDLLTGAFIAMTDGFAQASGSGFTPLTPPEMASQMISVLLDGLRPRPDVKI